MDKTSRGQFKPTLGLFDATAIAIGAIIGGGIFVVTGIVAGLAGPALVISIVLAAAISLFTALSFVELTKWLPVEGGVYEFAHKLISPFGGFLVGWMWIVSNLFAGAAVSLGFSHYFIALFPGVDFRVIAALLCLTFTMLNYIGMKQSAIFNNILVLTKILILLLFITAGIFHVKASNYIPFVTSQKGIFIGAFFIFFAYAGFARVAVIAEEVKDARRIVPQSIILALTISTIIYILVGIVAVGLINAKILGRSNSPLALAISTIGHPSLVYVVSLGGMIATASVLLTSILGVSRMAFAMARERDLPLTLSKIHPKHNTPYRSILIVGAIMAGISLFGDLSGVVAISTFGSLFYYAFANASALKLKTNRRFYQKSLSALGLATCLILLVFVQLTAFIIGLTCLLIGALYYIGKNKLR
jgi:APA family basic amino acid/polyamine antiporter